MDWQNANPLLPLVLLVEMIRLHHKLTNYMGDTIFII